MSNTKHLEKYQWTSQTAPKGGRKKQFTAQIKLNLTQKQLNYLSKRAKQGYKKPITTSQAIRNLINQAIEKEE